MCPGTTATPGVPFTYSLDLWGHCGLQGNLDHVDFSLWARKAPFSVSLRIKDISLRLHKGMCKTLVLHCLGWFCLPPSSLPKNKQMPAMASSGFFLPTWDTKGRNPLILCSLHSWKRELAFPQLGDSSLLTFQYWLITYYILDVWISLFFPLLSWTLILT